MTTVLLALVLHADPSSAPVLTRDARMRAEEAIQRVRYGHVIDARVPFERAVTREVIEGNVDTALRQSVLLADRWHTPITEEMLRSEVARIAAHTQYPERLRELYAALDHDALLIEECLARPILADRLVHERFASDPELKSASFEGWWARARTGVDLERLAPVAAPRSAIAQPAADSVANNTWTDLPRVDFLSPRRLALSVWTGSVVIVWGGYDDLSSPSVRGDGARYDPVTDSWSSMRQVGAPPPGLAQWSQAVWTGRFMVVWEPFRPSGRRYDPISDTWFPMSTSNAPTVPYGASAVWTGDRMIVWGGTDNAGTYFDTGGQYDPTTNVWTRMATLNAPAPRYGHSAVWTGDRMIVWGGEGAGVPGNPNGYLGTGGIYDPATDTWTPMADTAAPTARAQHTAVWTGSRMLVWGGWALWDIYGNTFFTNTGAQYDPSQDRWTPISTSGAPNARTDQAAIWNGTFMVVWGGTGWSSSSAEFVTLKTGGRYDPAHDMWWTTSVPETLTSRSGHTGVWTGAALAVWGGWAGDPSPGALSHSGSLYRVSGNHPPTPTAPAVYAECLSPAGTPVSLDGSASTDLDSTPGTNDDIVSYAWFEGDAATGVPLGDGVTISTSFTRGQHLVTLQAQDRQGEAESAHTSVFVTDSRPPTGSITSPSPGACFGSADLPVVIHDDIADLCDPAPVRRYEPAGPTFVDHGDHTVTESVTDRSYNAWSGTIAFTIDLQPPQVTLSPLPPSIQNVPFALAFQATDDDGATGGVVHEVAKLSGCMVFDGLTYGNRDGLLSDETIELSAAALCDLAAQCGFTRLDAPVLSVEATDCGGNVGTASHTFAGSIDLRYGACGSRRLRPPVTSAPRRIAVRGPS